MQQIVEPGRDTATGPPPRPVGEKDSPDTAAPSGPAEGSPEPLANIGTRTPSSDGENVAVSLADSTKVVRATCRIRIFPSDIAEDRSAHRNGKCDRDKCSACKMIRAFWEAQLQYAKVCNAIVRRLWEVDSAFVEEFQLREGRPPKGKEWPLPAVNSYQVGRLVAPGLRPGITAMAAHHVAKKWAKNRWRSLVVLDRRPDFYRRDASFAMRADVYKFEVGDDPGTYSFSFNLTPGRHPGGAEFRVPVTPRDVYQRNLYAKIAGRLSFDKNRPAENAPEWPRGSCQVERDKRGRWYLRMAYSRRISKRKDGISAGINRGLRCFLAAVAENGDQWIYDGNDIAAHLQQIKKRRQGYQRDSKASRRLGHGRRRTMAPLVSLQQKGERWRATKCQTVAKRFAEWCQKNNVNVVYVEDFSGIRNGHPEILGKPIWDRIQEWPYYQLQMRMASTLAEAGIRVVTVSPEYISQTCPLCGTVDAGSMDLRRHRFRCTGCGYRRHLDIVAAQNVRVRGSSGAVPEEKQAPKATKSRKRAQGRKGPLATKGKSTRKTSGSGGRGGKR